jgi:hypothetical protein
VIYTQYDTCRLGGIIAGDGFLAMGIIFLAYLQAG